MSHTLDAEMVARAYEIVRPAIVTVLQNKVAARADLAIVVTAIEAIQPWSDVEGERFEDRCYLVTSIGDLANSSYPNLEIALSKAKISARTGLPTAGLAPQYRRRGDTLFWGSAVMDGIVVACAGLEEHYDEMFSYWTAAAVQAVAKRAFGVFVASQPDASFLA